MFTPTSIHRPTSCVTAFAAAAIFAFTLGAPAASAKGGPTVTVEGDVSVEQPVEVHGVVTVEQPVEVHGVVETLNDLLYQPYLKSGLDRLAAGEAPRSLTVSFDVPDGKRLIVETLAFQARKPGEESRLFLEPQALGNSLTLLPVQYKSNDGYLISALPMKLRIDSIVGSNRELRVRLGFTQPPADLDVSIFGYLVDL